MNALYVTVSISLLLVLAGFNHAHGLTTFGKPNNQGQGTTNQQPIAQGKLCTHQVNCSLIKNTTCIRSYCLCGDNNNPINGVCSAKFKGPNHLCQTKEECVKGADCVDLKEKKPPGGSLISANIENKVCQCEEGLIAKNAICSGGTMVLFLPGVLELLVISVLAKIY